MGLGAPGLHGPSGGPEKPQALRPSKEASGDAAQCSRNHFATLPIISLDVEILRIPKKYS